MTVPGRFHGPISPEMMRLPREIRMPRALSRLNPTLIQGDAHDYDSNVRIPRCRVDYGFSIARDHVQRDNPAIGSLCGRDPHRRQQTIDGRLKRSADGRHATSGRSQRGSSSGVAIAARAGTPSGRTPDNAASWIQSSASISATGVSAASARALRCGGHCSCHFECSAPCFTRNACGRFCNSRHIHRAHAVSTDSTSRSHSPYQENINHAIVNAGAEADRRN
jgi:hypothetical protein